MLSEYTSSRTKADAAYEAMEALGSAHEEDARRIYDQKCNAANYTNATQDVLGKAEALENHVQTVTMRADSLPTTESDFFQPILDRHEEAQNALNALSAQLRTVAIDFR